MNPEMLATKFRLRLGDKGVLMSDIGRKPYESSARHRSGKAIGVLRPQTTDDLCWVVEQLASAGESFVTQGAASGLVGAATPHSTGFQWVLSTMRLKEKLVIDPINRSATVSAGYRLSELNLAAEPLGLTFPIDLGADPSIGGMVSTNTGGSRLIRFGGVRENLLATQGVLVNPPGQQVGSSRGLRKNNTGIEWSQLFAGTFGAFGIVSEATLKLHPIQRQSATALVAVDSVATAISLVVSLESDMGEFVSAFEGISGNALRVVAAHTPGATCPFESIPEYAVLLEVSSAIPVSSGLNLEAMLMAWMEREMDRGSIQDAVIDKPLQLWRIRHAISESVQSTGRLIAFDVSVKRSDIANFRAHAITAIEHLIPTAYVCDFGHLGDGGVHLNMVIPDETHPELIEELRTTIYDLVVGEYDGSFSAEHGIGPYNQTHYARHTDAITRSLAHTLHQHLDPSRLLGNVQLD